MSNSSVLIWEGKQFPCSEAVKRIREELTAAKDAGSVRQGNVMEKEIAISFHHQTLYFLVHSATVYSTFAGFSKSDGFVARHALNPNFPGPNRSERIGTAPLLIWEGNRFFDRSAWKRIVRTLKQRTKESNGNTIEVEVALIYDLKSQVFRAFAQAYYRDEDGQALTDGFLAQAGAVN